jgi:tungstate transport system ATP-binding protein
MPPGDALYRLESIRHQYGSRVVLDLDEFEVMRGEALAVVGPSGSGKSTLLRLLQFLERPGRGTIAFEGRTVEGDPPLATRRRVSTVFQRPVMLARSVRDNIAFGLRIRGAGTDGRIKRLLESLDLASLANAPARSLSGGEIQRVAIARALAFDPDVILLDEPTANLDPRNVRLVEDLVRERRRTGVTVVLATHQIFQARRLADRTALLLDGRLVESGATASLMDGPRDPRTRAFLTGEMIY